MKANIDSESAEDTNKIAERQTADERQKSSRTSLRRSLSLVSLSELVTPMTVRENKISDSRVDHCVANVDGYVSVVSGCSSKEQSAVDIVGREEHSLDVSNEESVTEIPPLVERLRLNQLQSYSATAESVSSRTLAAEQLSLSDSTAVSRRDEPKNLCLNKSSQRTANSDSVLLPSRRRRALKMRTAMLLSDDDVFLDSTKPSVAKSKQNEPCSQENLSEDISDTGTGDTDIFQFDSLDNKLKESVTESEIIQKFQSSLHIVDKSEDVESGSSNGRCLPEHYQITESLGEFVAADYCVATDAVASSVDALVVQSTTVSSQQSTGPLLWSPRHCSNFCIETSIINTPSVGYSDSCENALQVCKTSLSDVKDLNNESRTLHEQVNTGNDRANTGNDRNVFTDEVSYNGDTAVMSDLLFDDSVLTEEQLVLSADIIEGHCTIAATENDNSHCNENDYSVIVID